VARVSSSKAPPTGLRRCLSFSGDICRRRH
jgi:hypothetical protein